MTRADGLTLHVFTEIDGQTRSRACRFAGSRFVIDDGRNAGTVEADAALDCLVHGLDEASERPGSSADLVVVAQSGDSVSPCIIATLTAERWVDMTHALTPRAVSWTDLRDEMLTCLTMLVTSGLSGAAEKVPA